MLRVSFSSTRAARCCPADMAAMASAGSSSLPPSVTGPGAGHGKMYSNDPGDEVGQRVKRLKVVVDATDVQDRKKLSLVEGLLEVWDFADYFRYQPEIRGGKPVVEPSADTKDSDMTFHSIAKELDLLQGATYSAVPLEDPTASLPPPQSDSAPKKALTSEQLNTIDVNRKAAARMKELKQKKANDAVFEAQQWLP